MEVEGTETNETDVSETVDTSTATGAGVAEAVSQDAAPGVAATQYDWATWDGTVDKLPTDHKYGQQIIDYYDTLLSDAKKDSEAFDDLYRRLINDPSGKEEIERLRSDLKNLKEQTESRIEADAKAYAAWFRRAYGWVFDDETVKARVMELTGKGWSPEGAADLTKFSETAQNEAIEDFEETGSEVHALKVANRIQKIEQLEAQLAAKAEAKPKTEPKPEVKAETPRSAEAIRGATPARKPTPPRKKQVRDAASLEEARNLALDKIFSN